MTRSRADPGAVGGAEDRWQVSGGFFQVSNNKATVLADSVKGGPAA